MMRAMTKRVIEAVVATSHPLPAYGDVRIDDSVLDGFAEDLLAGRIPMFVQHDLRRPMDAKIFESAVRPTPTATRTSGFASRWTRINGTSSTGSARPPAHRAGSRSRAQSC